MKLTKKILFFKWMLIFCLDFAQANDENTESDHFDRKISVFETEEELTSFLGAMSEYDQIDKE